MNPGFVSAALMVWGAATALAIAAGPLAKGWGWVAAGALAGFSLSGST